MRVERLGYQDNHYANYTIANTVITVNNEDIDIAALESDSQEIVDIHDGDAYLATIEIPPARYETVSTGQTDEFGNPIKTKQRCPLNMEDVIFYLWPMRATVNGEGEE